MTGLLLTAESFNRYAKNYKKIKSDLTLYQAQEELAHVFCAKDLFTLKKSMESQPLYINENNFNRYSERLNIGDSISDKENLFAKIIGYGNKKSFELNIFAEHFIKFLYLKYRNEDCAIEKIIITIQKNRNSFTLCFFDALKNRNPSHSSSLFGITFTNNNTTPIDENYFIGDNFNGLKNEEEKIRFCTNRQSFLSKTSKKEWSSRIPDILDTKKSVYYYPISSHIKREVEPLIDLFEGKTKEFLDELYPILDKKLNITNNKYDNIIIGINRRPELVIVDNIYYEKKYYAVPKSWLKEIISSDEKILHNKEYIETTPFKSKTIYEYSNYSLEETKEYCLKFQSLVIMEGLTIVLKRPEIFIVSTYYEPDDNDNFIEKKIL